MRVEEMTDLVSALAVELTGHTASAVRIRIRNRYLPIAD
jgi:hypothetical protein